MTGAPVVLYRILQKDVRDRRDLWSWVATISVVSTALSVSLDVTLQMVFFISWEVAIRSWIGTVGITLLVAVPVTHAIGRTNLRLYSARQEVARLARTDEPTGLPNRRAYAELAAAAADDADLAIALLDIDHFKAINDRFGHATGDAVIADVARRLAAGLSAFGRVCRTGGEEFALVARAADATALFHALDHVRDAIADRPIPTLGGQIRVTVSAGLSCRRAGQTTDQLYSAADSALYAAKRAGRNRVWFDGPVGPAVLTRPSDDLDWVPRVVEDRPPAVA